jgi:hypothetical protein
LLVSKLNWLTQWFGNTTKQLRTIHPLAKAEEILVRYFRP